MREQLQFYCPIIAVIPTENVYCLVRFILGRRIAFMVVAASTMIVMKAKASCRNIHLLLLAATRLSNVDDG